MILQHLGTGVDRRTEKKNGSLLAQRKRVAAGTRELCWLTGLIRRRRAEFRAMNRAAVTLLPLIALTAKSLSLRL
jgi:hypothetical protein